MMNMVLIVVKLTEDTEAVVGYFNILIQFFNIYILILLSLLLLLLFVLVI